MSWLKNELDLTIAMFENGDTYAAISNVVPRSAKAIRVKLNKLGYNYKKIAKKRYCKNCNIEITKTKFFCSNSCSASFNNKNRKITIAKKIIFCQICKSPIEVDSRASIKSCSDCKKKKSTYIKVICRYCKYCKTQIPSNRKVCDNCKLNYHFLYRNDCKFNFNLYEYPMLFDLKLIEAYGMYSPSNKKNNLNGVSRDHMYSVSKAFKNKINPIFISHPANCKLVRHKENQKKYSKSSITFKALVSSILDFEKTHPTKNTGEILSLIKLNNYFITKRLELGEGIEPS